MQIAIRGWRCLTPFVVTPGPDGSDAADCHLLPNDETRKGSSLRNHALVACKNPDCPICHPKPKTPVAPLFQIQLQLLADGRPVAGLPYSCYLSDGTRAAGTTDAKGLSGAIITRTEASVLRIGVSAPSKSKDAACCSAPEAWWQDERLYVGGDGNALAKTTLSTTPPVAPISLPKGKERSLTRGEEAMARTVFGDGIDYSKVKIHHGGWWVFAGNQDPDTAVTPNGKIYMPSAIYREDYSSENGADRRLFMHELVHVWQFQMGYNVKLNALRVTSQGAIRLYVSIDAA